MSRLLLESRDHGLEGGREPSRRHDMDLGGVNAGGGQGPQKEQSRRERDAMLLVVPHIQQSATILHPPIPVDPPISPGILNELADDLA